jgi:hypothetical protein
LSSNPITGKKRKMSCYEAKHLIIPSALLFHSSISSGGEEGGGRRQRGAMAQTMYAHINK